MRSTTMSFCALLLPMTGCLLPSSRQDRTLRILEAVYEPTCIIMQPYQCQKDLLNTIGDTSDIAVDFFVSVCNHSEMALLMPVEWCSWGYDNLGIERHEALPA